jgi:Flp pilus assembly protein TadD
MGLRTNGMAFFLSLAVLASASYAATPPPTYDELVQKGKSQLQAGNAVLALESGRAAIMLSATRWEGYAVAGGALMNLKRYEEAADTLSEAIKTAPEAKQAGLRDLRRQCLASEGGTATVSNVAPPTATTSQAEIVLWKSIEYSSNLADFQYLDQYPQGAFAVLAHRHLSEAAGLEQARIRQAVADAEQREREAAWEDASAGLTWTVKDNDGNGLDYAHATMYCSQLRLLGYSNWRLPTYDEIMAVSTKYRGLIRHLKSDFHLHDDTSALWTMTPANHFWNTPEGHDIVVTNGNGQMRFHALCVRTSE